MPMWESFKDKEWVHLPHLTIVTGSVFPEHFHYDDIVYMMNDEQRNRVMDWCDRMHLDYKVVITDDRAFEIVQFLKPFDELVFRLKWT